MPWSELHAGWILAAILIVVVYIYLRKTKSGMKYVWLVKVKTQPDMLAWM